MNKHKRLVIVANQPSINTQRLSEAVVRGASDERIEGIEILFRDPLSATADDVLGCDGIIIGTTENFGYMSGLIKDFFERIYYPCLEKTEGLPYALYIRAGNDGSGTGNRRYKEYPSPSRHTQNRLTRLFSSVNRLQ